MIVYPAPIRNESGTLPWLNWFNSVYEAIKSFGTIKGVYSSSVTIDIANITANSTVTTTATVTGCRVNATNPCTVIVQTQTPTTGIITDGYVSSDDTVTIRAMNITTGAINPVSKTYQITVIQY